MRPHFAPCHLEQVERVEPCDVNIWQKGLDLCKQTVSCVFIHMVPYLCRLKYTTMLHIFMARFIVYYIKTYSVQEDLSNHI